MFKIYPLRLKFQYLKETNAPPRYQYSMQFLILYQCVYNDIDISIYVYPMQSEYYYDNKNRYTNSIRAEDNFLLNKTKKSLF